MQTQVLKIVAIEIPNTRTFMHLDTVLTMIDYDKFTVHAAIFKERNNMNIFTIEQNDGKDDIKITRSSKLRETLAEVLEVEKWTLFQQVMATLLMVHVNNGMMAQTHYVFDQGLW